LATGLAHELNQPLAAVCLQAELAARLRETDDPTSQAELGEALREISEQSHRAADIIRTLRRMIRRSDPAQKPVDLNEVARAVVRLIDWQARRAGVEVHLRLEEDPPPPQVTGDRTQLEQVTFNLLQNAVEAAAGADAGPRVAQIETAWDGKGRVILTVRDTGPGLKPGEEARVFERFFTTKPDGMGMGLAIGKSIVEAHGGKMYVAHHIGRGAAFAFALPAGNGES
jgi:C4-dicarboxylate-specific signal transduction histidine kinase